MELPIQKGSVLEDFSCSDKEPAEVKLMSERVQVEQRVEVNWRW